MVVIRLAARVSHVLDVSDKQSQDPDHHGMITHDVPRTEVAQALQSGSATVSCQ